MLRILLILNTKMCLRKGGEVNHTIIEKVQGACKKVSTIGEWQYIVLKLSV